MVAHEGEECREFLWDFSLPETYVRDKKAAGLTFLGCGKGVRPSSIFSGSRGQSAAASERGDFARAPQLCNPRLAPRTPAHIPQPNAARTCSNNTGRNVKIAHARHFSSFLRETFLCSSVICLGPLRDRLENKV